MWELTSSHAIVFTCLAGKGPCEGSELSCTVACCGQQLKRPHQAQSPQCPAGRFSYSPFADEETETGGEVAGPLLRWDTVQERLGPGCFGAPRFPDAKEGWRPLLCCNPAWCDT